MSSMSDRKKVIKTRGEESEEGKESEVIKDKRVIMSDVNVNAN